MNHQNYTDKIVHQLRQRLPLHGVVNQTELLLNTAHDWLLKELPGANSFISKLYSTVLASLPLVPLAKVVKRISSAVAAPVEEWSHLDGGLLAEAFSRAKAEFYEQIYKSAVSINDWANRYGRIIIVGGVDAEVEQALQSVEEAEYEAAIVSPDGLDNQTTSQFLHMMEAFPRTRLLNIAEVTAGLQWGRALLIGNAITTSTGDIYGNPSMIAPLEMAFPRMRDIALLCPPIRRLVPIDHFTFEISAVFKPVAKESAVRTFIAA